MSRALPLAVLALVACAAPPPPSISSIAEGPMPAAEVYDVVDGVALNAFVFAPPGHGARRPALLLIHGGGWGGGQPALMAPHGRYFAARGWVAVVASYRLTSRPGVTPHDCVRDTAAALRWIRAQGARLGVDPRRVAAAGDSAGGHLAAALAVLPQLDRAAVPDAVVLWNPITDTTAAGWNLRPGPRAPALAEPLEDWQRRISPLAHVRPGLPPTLILHGTADTVVPIAQSRRYVEALRAAGDRAELVELPGRKHAFVLPGYRDNDDATVAEALARSEAFLRSAGVGP
jgi:acetyl esterase/lipase